MVPPPPAPRLVLGVDPGTHRLGWGVVYRQGSRFVHVDHGVVRAPAQAQLPERLRVVAAGLESVLAQHAITVGAIEQAYVAKDPHAALVIGHARGVAMLMAARAACTVVEYPPSVIKKAVAGTGRADKAQVSAMVRAILGLPEVPQEDAGDALALAICHASALPLPPRS